MADFNAPNSTSLYTAVWTLLSSVVTTTVTMFDGTTDSNIPDKAKRYNTSTNKFQVYSSGGGTWANLPFHTTIDNHIADTSIHTTIPLGVIWGYGGSSLPTGYAWCRGGTFLRSDAVFAVIGTTYGVGDGATTANYPDLQRRIPIGKASSGSASTLGSTGGTWDHDHSVPSHSHAIAAHTHTMKNHTHTVASHTHTGPSHSHVVEGHGHNADNALATINIAAGGGHTHQVRYATGIGGSTTQLTNADLTAVGNNFGTGWNTDSNTHTHAHSTIVGTVGAWDGVTGGINGDSNFNTQSSGTGVTGGTALTSNAPNDNTTDSGGPTSTSTDGSSTTGTNNPPWLAINFIIKI